MRIVTKLGTFYFPKGTALSRAKLIAYTVTGQWLAPKKDEPYLRTEEDAYKYILNSDSKVLAEIPFELALN